MLLQADGSKSVMRRVIIKFAVMIFGRGNANNKNVMLSVVVKIVILLFLQK